MVRCNCNYCRREGAFRAHKRRPALLSLVLRLIAPLLSVALLTACAPDDPPAADYDCDGVQPHFTVRPVRVEASDAMPDDCIEATIAAVDFWRARDVTMLLSVVPPTAPSLSDEHVPGVVSVQWGTFQDAWVAGETRGSQTLLCDVYDAKVTIKLCTALVAIHELGHALGLVHDPTPGNVMFKAVEGMGWELTAEQLAWVRDP